MIRTTISISLTLAALALVPSAASAQSSPRLVEALRMAQDAQGDSARARVGRMLASTPATDTLYPEILYTAGMIATSTEDMGRYFQRVVVEHSSSRWADASLYRLAQLEYAAGDYAGAAKQLERIRSDYPTSPILPHASYWAAEAWYRAKDAGKACQWAEDGVGRAGSDVELRRQLEQFKAEKCGPGKPVEVKNVDATKADTAAKPVAKPAEKPAKETVPTGAFQVQLAALPDRATADAELARFRARGVKDLVIVEEKGLHKLRVAGFRTRADAQAAAKRLGAELKGSYFIVAAPK